MHRQTLIYSHPLVEKKNRSRSNSVFVHKWTLNSQMTTSQERSKQLISGQWQCLDSCHLAPVWNCWYKSTCRCWNNTYRSSWKNKITVNVTSHLAAVNANHEMLCVAVCSWRRGTQGVWNALRTCGCVWGRTTPLDWLVCLWRAAPSGMCCCMVSHRQILPLVTQRGTYRLLTHSCKKMYACQTNTKDKYANLNL